mmetsp:Transcript_3109/g.7763  ORF Transcript_3109/g.7763 Transcript_3109/m.7763 type:complete len:331 (-) Transcript_3109:336-1328(-)
MQPTMEPTAPDPSTYPSQLEAQAPMPTSCPYIVHGKWRDGLCDFCSPGSRQGFFMALCGPCCWPCLISKIAARLRFSPGCNILGNTPFKQWLRITTFVMALMWMCWFMMARINGSIASLYWEDYVNHQNDPNNHTPYNPNAPYSPGSNQWVPSPETTRKIREAVVALDFFDSLVWLMGVGFTFVICFLRFRTRTKFLIPTTFDSPGQRPAALGPCEDFCCAWCCACCSLAQMARHTHAADDGCDLCTDPGPAETMLAPMVDYGQAHQMQVFSVQQQQPNSMYQPPVAVPVATAVTPVYTPGGVPQGRPIDAGQGDNTETAEVYDAKRNDA